MIKRPLHTELRQRVGHWEYDTVIGANHKGCWSDYSLAQKSVIIEDKLTYKTSELAISVIIDNLKAKAARVKTLTFDNSNEFAEHAYFNHQLECASYFARPFASSELGSNENLNGLLSQFVLK